MVASAGKELLQVTQEAPCDLVRDGRGCCGVIPSSLDRCKIHSMPERPAPSLAVTTAFEIDARAEALGVGLSLLFFCHHFPMCPSLVCSSTNNILSAGNFTGDETGQGYEALAKLCRGLAGRNVDLSVLQDYGVFRGHCLVDLQSEQRRPLSW